MQKTALISLAAMGMAVAPAFAEDSRDYDFAGFDKVDVSAGYDADIEVGDDFSVRAVTKGGDLERMKIEVKGSTLHIGRKNNISWNSRGPRTTVYVTMPSLVSLEVSSGADADARGIDSETFNVDTSSGADAKVSGTCGRISADASSGSDIRAKELVCESGSADSSSGADIVMTVTGEVSADASSGSDIIVYGGAKGVRIDTSSGGDVSIRQ